ncbi:RagB/SusD family nutrient uptake outer membrane protein [Flavobacteriaceae bacterium TK19130]|nr:RagB/SusD family nutrient uptake outer membrane protein [Thermobacterium salinum]
MKNIKLIFSIFFALALFTSCEDQLNVTNPAALSAENFIFDGDSAEQALLDAYNDMQSRYVMASEPKMIQGLYSDELKHPGSFPHLNQALINNFLTDNFGLTNIFSNHYDIINTATEAIRGTEALDESQIDPERQAQLLAEAHALRAFAYFQLVKTFGGLPITERTVPFDGPEANDEPRQSQEAVYDYILSEIALAEGNIDPSNPISRFTNDAVRVLKASVFLFRGNYPGVENTLQPLIGDYSLVESYGDLWNNDLENSEAIFRVNYTSSDAGDLQTFFTPQGRREVAPTESLVNAFESGDERLNQIVNPNDPNTVYVGKYMNNQFKPYVYRYADVLLMYAEALARRNAPNASDFINEVRNRAGLGDINLTSGNVVPAISQERRIEFFAEGKRWEDVKRLGLAEQVISSKQGITFNSRQVLWPIPQDELDRNGAMSQADQNPGY